MEGQSFVIHHKHPVDLTFKDNQLISTVLGTVLVDITITVIITIVMMIVTVIIITIVVMMIVITEKITVMMTGTAEITGMMITDTVVTVVPVSGVKIIPEMLRIGVGDGPSMNVLPIYPTSHFDVVVD